MSPKSAPDAVTGLNGPMSGPGPLRSEWPQELRSSSGPVSDADRPVRKLGPVRTGQSESESTQSVSTGTQQGTLRPQAGNVRGNTRDPVRGSYCTPKWMAHAVGGFDLDPFSNPRSHIVADASCQLERGEDGFGNGRPGSFTIRVERGALVTQQAIADDLIWLQPDYQFVLRAFNHYAHTRWVALLRFDPRPEWFDAIYAAAELIAVIRHDPDGKPFNFEPPPGVRASSNSFPHALYARHAEDVPQEVLRYCAAWRKRPS